MKIFLIILFSIYINADFTLTYRINNKIIQTTYFKDNNHTLVKLKEANKTLQELLILDNKRYLKFKDKNQEKIYELPPKKEKTDLNYTKKIDYTILEVQENGGYDFKTQKWLIQKDDKNETVIVSNDNKLYNKVQKMVWSLRRILPKEQERRATIFDMGKGFALVKSNHIEMLSYNENNISQSLFNIDSYKAKILRNVKLNLQRCSMHICCGDTKRVSKSKELINYLKPNSRWKLLNIANCDNNSSKKTMENAIITDSNDYIVLDLNRDKISKLDKLKEKGIKIDNLKEDRVNGYSIKYTYLPEIDATIGEIKLSSKSIFIYSMGEIDIIDFVKESLNLKRENNYTLSN